MLVVVVLAATAVEAMEMVVVALQTEVVGEVLINLVDQELLSSVTHHPAEV
jgi:hypothetical protein